MRRSTVSVLLLLLWMLPAAAAQAQQCPSGLVGYWPLDGSAVESVNGLEGVLVGNVTFVAAAVSEGAHMDGDSSYIQLEAHPELAFGGTEMSFSAWVKPEPDVPSDGWNDEHSAVITSRNDCGWGNWQMYDRIGYTDPPNTLMAMKWPPDAETTFLSTEFYPHRVLPMGEWSHIVFALKDNVGSFYVNGALVDRAENGSSPLEIKDEILRVQLGWDSCGSYFTGTMDEVAVYDRELTGEEALAIYLGGLEGAGQCELSSDSDNDGVIDGADVCPNTGGAALVDGCDCQQILSFKPGKGGQCTPGVLDVFRRRSGWAKGVPLPGQGQN